MMVRYVLALLVAVLGTLTGFCFYQFAPAAGLNVDARSTVLANVTLINPGLPIRNHVTIRIDDGVIASIQPATDRERLLPQKFVLPGLIDMHVHQPVAFGGLPDYFSLLYLKHGVTSVRYTGHTGTGDAVERQRDKINEGQTPGPRVFSCGRIVEGSPALWPTSIVMDDPDRADEIVQQVKASGADCLKVYGTMQQAPMLALIAAAGHEGLPVVGHVPRHTDLLGSGIGDVQHLIGVPGIIPEESAVNPMVDGWDTLSAVRIDQVARGSAEQRIAHTPTLVFHWSNALREQHDFLSNNTAAHLMPRLFSEVAWAVKPGQSIRLGGSRTSEMRERLLAAHEKTGGVVEALHRQGVVIHAGTDTGNPFLIPGAALIQEVSMLADAGLGIEGALVAATRHPGTALNVPMLGVIEVGAPADLLLLKQNPTSNLSALDSIETVIAQGRAYPISFLDAEVKRYRDHYANFLWDKIFPVLARLLG